MKTILIIRVPKPHHLCIDLLEINDNVDYCKLDEEFDQYLYNLYFDMKDRNSKSGIFATNHNLDNQEYINCIREFAKVNKIKFIIVK